MINTDINDPEIPNSSFIIHNLHNYPNPFNPITTIEYSIPQDCFINITIYNIKGQKVKQLVNNQITLGKHSIVWKGKDDNNKPVTSGIYLYKLKTDNFEKTKKMILMK